MTDVLKNLTNLIKNYDKVYVMTHKNPDLDGLGACICFHEIIKSFKKECAIIDSKEINSSTVIKMYEKLKEENINLNKIMKKQALKEITDNTLLLIIDVHKKDMVEVPELVDLCKHIVVLDHHIKGDSYIKDTEFTYLNSGLSSMIEFSVYYLKYLNKTVDSLIATIMLTGMEIDTNGYNLKTTDKTYEAAAQLTKMGADNIIKQEILKENKNDYVKRSDLVKHSYMINENMAMCTLDEEYYTPKDLATISEQLLQFDDVEASFTIGNLNENTVGVSARSIGKIDVEVIMKKMGGGGHVTEAAVQVKDSNIKTVKKQIIEIVSEAEEK